MKLVRKVISVLVIIAVVAAMSFVGVTAAGEQVAINKEQEAKT